MEYLFTHNSINMDFCKQITLKYTIISCKISIKEVLSETNDAFHCENNFMYTHLYPDNADGGGGISLFTGVLNSPTMRYIA